MIFKRTMTQDPFNMFMDPLMSTTWDITKFSPNSKVTETDNGFEIMVAVPGITSDELSVEVDWGKSTLHVEYDGEGNNFVQAFKKTYKVPLTIDLGSIEVEVEHGVITLTLSRKEESSRKKIL
jgi:HSP20 family protein